MGQDADPETVTAQVQANDQIQRLFVEAEALLGRGQNDAAFELLSKHEFDLAGNPLYDYLLGVAALDSGRYGEAIFSLQRALELQPDYSGARMALARAHYEAGKKPMPGLSFCNSSTNNHLPRCARRSNSISSQLILGRSVTAGLRRSSKLSLATTLMLMHQPPI